MDRLPLLPASAAPRAPAWEVAHWFGPATSLDDLAGKVIVMHAFQMLCPGCVLHGIPQASNIHRVFDPADVAVIGLHSVFEHHEAMTPTSLAAFLYEFRVQFPVAVDAHADGRALPITMGRYELRGTPSLLLIDRQGRLRANVFGNAGDLAVGAAIATLVSEAATP
jgi:AhpC/TSA family